LVSVVGVLVRGWSSFVVLMGAELSYGGVCQFGNVGRAELTGSFEGSERADVVAFLLEQEAEVAGAGGVAALVGALVGGLGAGAVVLLFEQGAEVPGADGVTAFVGALVGQSCAGHVASLLE
jgi:hypothetical protein